MTDTPPTWPGTREGFGGAIIGKGRYAFTLLLRNQQLQLSKGDLSIGRSPSCDIVIDDMLVSRKHARLLVWDNALIVVDLDSVNGVFVNEMRISSPTPLRDGDRVLIGGQELSVFAAQKVEDERPTLPEIEHAPVVPLTDRATQPEREALDIVSQRMPSTRKADAFAHLGRLADRMLAMGRPEAAVRVLSGHIHDVLDGARAGRAVPRDVLDAVAQYTTRFATATKDGAWLDILVELHLIVKLPMPEDVLDDVISLLGSVQCDREMFLMYQAVLRASAARFGGAERSACDRILCMAPPS